MVGWIILGVIVGIIVLIMLVPIGADVNYEDGELTLSAKVSGMLLQLIPKAPVDESKPKKEKKPKKPKKPKKEKKKKAAADGAKKPKKKLKLKPTKDDVFGLIKAVLKGFGVFGKKLNVERFMLHYTAGGKDPYDTAVTLSYVNAALSALAPICAKRFEVKDSSVWTNVDFTAEKLKLDVAIAVTIRIGAIFRMIFTIIFGVLWIVIKYLCRQLVTKLRNKLSGKKEGALTEGVNTEENNKENIQAEERNDNNGK